MGMRITAIELGAELERRMGVRGELGVGEPGEFRRRLKMISRRLPGYLQTAEVCENLGVGSTTIHRYVEAGWIYSFVHKGRRHYLEADVRRIQENREYFSSLDAGRGGRRLPVAVSEIGIGAKGGLGIGLGEKGKFDAAVGLGGAVEGDIWVTNCEAAGMLGVAAGTMRRIADVRGFEVVCAVRMEPANVTSTLRRGRSRWYKLGDVMGEIQRREEVAIERSVPCGIFQRYHIPICIRTEMVAPPNDRLITVQEAANFLEVSRRRIGQLVASGKLFSWQKEPGKMGSRMYLSANQVGRYEQERERKRLALIEKGEDADRFPDYHAVWKEEIGFRSAEEYDAGSIMDRDFGEYFTVGQAAQILGTSKGNVRRYRITGKLTGYHRSGKSESLGSMAWWFYRKSEVLGLRDVLDGKRRMRGLRGFDGGF